MPNGARTALTLTAGVAIGLLIGGYVHNADAQNSTAPCADTSPAVAKVRGHVVFSASGGGQGHQKVATKIFKAKTPFTIYSTASTAGQQIAGFVVGFLASPTIPILDNAIQATPSSVGGGSDGGFTRENSADCTAGCYLTMQSDNAKWKVVVTD